MINRNNQINISDDFFNNIQKIISEQENKTLYSIATFEKAKQEENELKLKGYNVKIEPWLNEYKIYIIDSPSIKLSDARKSKAFKKLAWGNYYAFQKQSDVNNKYDFDDGSIWKVCKDENGEEYLIKEVNENEEVIRGINDYINDDNYEKFAKIAFNLDNISENQTIQYMVNNNLKKDAFTVISKKMEEILNELICKNVNDINFINETKKLVIKCIKEDKVSNLEDIKNLILQNKSYHNKIENIFE